MLHQTFVRYFNLQLKMPKEFLKYIFNIYNVLLYISIIEIYIFDRQVKAFEEYIMLLKSQG